MLSKISELQDLLYQRWIMMFEPERDEEGAIGLDEFTGEIASAETGDHICGIGDMRHAQTTAEMILAAHELYKQMRGVEGSDDYIVPGPEADAFLRAFEEFVMKNSGW